MNPVQSQSPATRPPPNRLLLGSLIWIGGLSLFFALVACNWSPRIYWMDAENYVKAVVAGQWTENPPGYMFFVALGRFLSGVCLLDPATAMQVASLLTTVVGFPIVYLLLREVTGPLRSSALTVTFALSWVVVLLNHVGTSHATDFLTVPVLLWTILRFTARPDGFRGLMFVGALLLCAGFRLTTIIMMGPLLMAVLWTNRRSPVVWAACAVGGIAVVVLQLFVIHLFGGWSHYTTIAHGLHLANRNTSLLCAGFTGPALLNIGRTTFWFVLGTGWLWLALRNLRAPADWSAKDRTVLWFGALSMLGPLAVSALYLCPHPGYLTPAIPGFFLCVALAWEHAGPRPDFAKWPLAAIVTSLVLYLSLQVVRTPRTRFQAAANGLLLQFSADGTRNSIYMTTSAWLAVAGCHDAIPKARLEGIKGEMERHDAKDVGTNGN